MCCEKKTQKKGNKKKIPKNPKKFHGLDFQKWTKKTFAELLINLGKDLLIFPFRQDNEYIA